MVSAISNSGLPVNRLIALMGGLRASTAGPATAGPAVKPTDASSGAAVGKSELTDEERRQVEEFQKRDTEVRQHEQAHKAAAGRFASGAPSFDFKTGPDGKQYAVGGEVQIDTSPIEGDPEATVRKMEQIQAAALAPSEPSGQDRNVAAQATRAKSEAEAELASQRTSGSDGGPDSASGGLAAVSATSTPAATSEPPAASGGSAPDRSAASSAELAGLQSVLAAQDAPPPGRFIDVAA
ncbi:MAG: putative metalloprotease CJM1_0395 family protein [Phycisphaerae bacterium]